MRLHDISDPIPDWVADVRRWFAAKVPGFYRLVWDTKTKQLFYQRGGNPETRTAVTDFDRPIYLREIAHQDQIYGRFDRLEDMTIE